MKKRIYIIWLSIFIVNTVAAQKQKHRLLRQTDTAILYQISAGFRISSLQLRERGKKIYKQPHRYIGADGTVNELQGIGEDGELWIYGTSNLNAAKTVSTDKVWPGGSDGLSLTGQGLTIAIWDGGKVLNTHQEFTGRAVQKDGATAFSTHATHVSGTMIAAGIDPLAKGMAYEANLDAYDWNIDVAEMAQAAADGLILSNHSYKHIAGWNGGYWYGDTTISRYEDYKFGFYDAVSRQFDQICNAAPYYLPVIAASNDRNQTSTGGIGFVWNGSAWVYSSTVRPPDGPWDCIPTFCGAKNALTIGNVQDLPSGYTSPAGVVLVGSSSCGPTDDGRIKPDLVANGQSLYSSVSTGISNYGISTGTSMSSPNTTGSLALLQQLGFDTLGFYLKSATLKALVIATADEAGTAAGPDYMFGWGLLNASKAASLLCRNEQTAFIKELNITEGQVFSLPVYSDGLSPLSVTIAWNDPAGVSPPKSLNPGDLMLRNDLDVRVISSSDTTYPYVLNPANPAGTASTGDNFRDNVEKVFMNAPPAGVYTIVVYHKNDLYGGFQDFGLVVDGIQNLAPGHFLVQAVSGQQINLGWQLIDDKPVVLAYATNGVFGQPTNGQSYQTGDTITGGGIVLYTGIAESYQHTGLEPATIYHYRIWSALNGNPDYSEPNTGQALTFCEPAELPLAGYFDEAVAPVCWRAMREGNPQGWMLSATSHAGGNAYEWYHSWEDLYNNYTYGAPAATSRLVLPMVNTIGKNQITLRFRHKFADSYGYGIGTVTAKIQSSTDGTNWTDEGWSFTSRNGDLGPEYRAVTIQNNLNAPETYVAFTLSGDFYDFWYWAIDEIELYEGPSGLWTGDVSDDWDDTANWSDVTLPDSITPVIIPVASPYFPVIRNEVTSPVFISSLVIDTGATLMVDTFAALTVNGVVKNYSGAGGLLLKSGSSFINSTAGVQATVQQLIGGGEDYHHISSPVLKPTAISVLPPWAFLRRFDETQAGIQWQNLTGSDTLYPMIGYTTYLPEGDVLAAFAGELNAGTIQVSGLTHSANSTTQYDGFNLIGNPYPSVVDWESEGILLDNTDATIYFWDNFLNGGAGGYATYTKGVGGTNGATRYIAPAQGFFVKVSNPLQSGSVTIGQSARTHQPASFYKHPEKNTLKIKITGVSFEEELLVAIRESGPQAAAIKPIRAGTPAMYFVREDGQPFSVYCMKPDQKSISLAVCIQAIEQDSLKITVNGMDAFEPRKIFLEDLSAGRRVNLREEPEYKFNVDPAEKVRRFVLWLGPVN